MPRKVLAVLCLCVCSLLQAQRVGVPTEDLTELNVDDLFRVQVTSAGRKAQQLSRASAAVYVLTAEDIRRSGATSIPEALQWVPGLTVLPIDGRSWAISARGGATLYADKILVMVDGRSLYSPLFSGVIWDFINVPLENIEQIEVVRGPGSVMWGPNAVNGVINIITRPAKQTANVEVNAVAGNELRGSAIASVSSAPNERLAYRIWGKVEDRNPAFSSGGGYLFSESAFRDPTPVTSLDSRTASLGMRLDSKLSAKDQLMVQVDAFGTGRDEVLGYPRVNPGDLETLNGRTGVQGGSAQVRWTRTVSEGDERTLQFTYDNQTLAFPFLDARLNNLAIDYERRRQTGEQNEIYWSVGYQQYWDDTLSRRFVSFLPASKTYRNTQLTLRDEWQPVAGKLLVSGGVRLDYNSETQMEFQPTLRVLYTPSTSQSVWTAVSRAARMPNRVDRDMHTEGWYQMAQGFPVKISFVGSDQMGPETVYGAEAGYRYQSRQRWSFDSVLFWSYYPHLRALKFPQQPEIVMVGAMPSASITLREENTGKGRSYGSETSMILQITASWRLIPSYSYLREQHWTPNVTPAFGYAQMFGSSGPRHQGLLRSQHTINKHWQIDLMARAPSRNIAMQLPGFVRGDVRLAYRHANHWEVSLTTRNITNRQEFETFSEAMFVAIPLRRTFVLRCTMQL